MKKAVIYIFLITTLMGCEKKVNWTLQNGDANLVIVDGIITDELKPQTIKLTFPVFQLNATPTPVSGATVVISNEDSVFTLKESVPNSGIYQHTFAGVSGKNYTLLINYNNQVYSAKTTLLQGINIAQPLQYAKDTNDTLYHISYVANAYDAENFAMYEILLDWSKNQTMNIDSSARLLYYTLPTIDVSQIFAPGVQSVTFPAGTVINERRYSITRDYAAYIRALLLETKWQGGLFDSEHSNLPTNLSSGANGFFATCGVDSLSLKVTP